LNKQVFESYMQRAVAMRLSPAQITADCLAGYMRGLRLAYHGERSGSAADHEVWLGLIGSADLSCDALGRGYRAGLAGETMILHESWWLG
jgi:hypothetical protein